MADPIHPLLRGLLLNPEDDTPRLVYADWLQENGRRAEAGYIRSFLQGLPWMPSHSPPGCLSLPDGWVWAEMSQFRAGVVSRVNTLWYHRGFGAAIECRCDAFMRDADAIFRQHPITSVTLTDREPISASNSVGEQTYDWWDDRPEHSGNAMTTASGGVLPADLFDCLVGGLIIDPYEPDNFNIRSYASLPEAIAAADAACIVYGRRLAGLEVADAR